MGAGACSWLPGGSSRPPGAPKVVPSGAFVDVACGLPRQELIRSVNGYHPDRSGDVQIIPRSPNTFGNQHAGPWNWLQRVPMLFLGPGHVPPVGSVGHRASMADVAPTLAGHMRFPFDAPDGRALGPAAPVEGARPPRLILVVVWDGGGRNVLDAHPGAWPNLDRLIPEGVWFRRAVVGSSPSVTPPVHATLGTGAFPGTHGLVDLYVRDGREIVSTREGALDLLLAPTLGDAWDRSRDNRPIIGAVVAHGWHMGMASRGSLSEGGDRDVAALINPRSAWALPQPLAPYFQFPAYANDLPGLMEGLRALDMEDGARDGLWLGERIVDVKTWVTPAFIEWQTRLIEELIRREGFGADELTDLLFVNYKQIDGVGHRWGMATPQMEAVVRGSDKALGDLVAILDRRVGRGRWMLVLTADHGVVPPRAQLGGFSISQGAMLEDIDAAFDGDGDDRPVVQRYRPTELWLDEDELAEKGFTVSDVASFLLAYSEEQNRGEGPDASGGGHAVFAAAFPSPVLADLPCLPDVAGS